MTQLIYVFDLVLRRYSTFLKIHLVALRLHTYSVRVQPDFTVKGYRRAQAHV